MTTPLRPLPGPATGPRPRPRPKALFPKLSTVLVAVGALVAVNLIIVAVYVGGRGDQTVDLPPEIEFVVPAPDAVIRPQEDVGANLVDDHTGVLFIDGERIPEDQVTVISGLGEVRFRPGEGRDITRLTPGPHRATIVYWKQGRTEQEADAEGTLRSFTWKFTAG